MIVKHAFCVANKTVTLNYDALATQTSVTLLSLLSFPRFSQRVKKK